MIWSLSPSVRVIFKLLESWLATSLFSCLSISVGHLHVTQGKKSEFSTGGWDWNQLPADYPVRLMALPTYMPCCARVHSISAFVCAIVAACLCMCILKITPRALRLTVTPHALTTCHLRSTFHVTIMQGVLVMSD